MTQYVACRFRPGDKRKYTFHNDGDPVLPGDFVEAQLRDGSTKIVEVVDLVDEKPSFPTAPINKRVEKPASWHPLDDTEKLDVSNDAPPSFDV